MTQQPNSKTLMTWSRPTRRDHVMAAIGVVVGMLAVALFVIAVTVLNTTAAHASQDDPLGLRELGGALVNLAAIVIGCAAWVFIADTISKRKARR